MCDSASACANARVRVYVCVRARVCVREGKRECVHVRERERPHAQREAGENTFYSKRTRSIVRDHMLGAKHEGQHEGLGRIDLQRSERTGSHIKSLFPVSHMARWSERSPDTCRSIKCGDGGSCDSSRSQCHTEWLCGIAHQHGRCFGCMCKWGSLVLFCMFCLAGLF